MKKETLSFLIYGDIFGRLGRQIIKEQSKELYKKYNPDFTIANAENMTHGSGFSTQTINEMMDEGINFFTGGNHSLENINGKSTLKISNVPVIRPANISDTAPGDGYRLIQIKSKNVLIINLLGTLFMNQNYGNPFKEIDRILKEFKEINLSAIILDFHAETTSEKIALATYLDGKVSLVYGTHTHVPTADERVLKNGTGFITDVGFTGPIESIIGVNPQAAIYNFIHKTQTRNSVVESGDKTLNAIYVEINTKTGKCEKIERINKTINN